MQRKIWVRRPGASSTLVTVHADDLVDNVRDVILHKYRNSLGKSIDSPDITLKICSRDQPHEDGSDERILAPDEHIGRTLDAYYPGGQTIDEALIIDVPMRRTPRHSPHVGNHQIAYHYLPDELRPVEGARDYFPPMPPLHSPRLPAHAINTSTAHHPSSLNSMAIVSTGQLPPLPSPGAHSARRHIRPRYGRQHTSSPTILHTQANGTVQDPKQQSNGASVPSAPLIPTPPATSQIDHRASITPPNRTSSPHGGQRNRRNKKSQGGIASNPSVHGSTNAARSLKDAAKNATTKYPESTTTPAPPAPLLSDSVPPINVLIVEDNVINLKLLEQFMRRLKVRFQSAMNGREAVNLWRTGGFHLVLMDIQLPVMNGLDATKEIRRLEGVNSIGVFSGSPMEPEQKKATDASKGKNVEGDDNLGDKSLFKSPVIIVALTASSLQSDRHEALAAGCNDFLTKPVAFAWMERKVTEWGCMQALIDFEGWRKWKAYADKEQQTDPKQKDKEAKEEKAKTKAQLKAMFSRPPPSVKKDEAAKTKEKESAVPTGAAAPASAPAQGDGDGASNNNSSCSSNSKPGPTAATTDGGSGGGAVSKKENGIAAKGGQGHKHRASLANNIQVNEV